MSATKVNRAVTDFSVPSRFTGTRCAALPGRLCTDRLTNGVRQVLGDNAVSIPAGMTTVILVDRIFDAGIDHGEVVEIDVALQEALGSCK